MMAVCTVQLHHSVVLLHGATACLSRNSSVSLIVHFRSSDGHHPALTDVAFSYILNGTLDVA